MSITRISQLPIASALELTEGVWMAINTANNKTKRALVTDVLKSVGSGIFAAKTTIPAAEVLTMGIGDIPVEIVPAFGVGFSTELIRVSARVNFNSAAYATAADVYFGYSLGQPMAWAQNLLAATVNTHRQSLQLAATGAGNAQIMENAPLLAYTSISPTGGDSTVELFSLLRITQL